MEKCRVNIGILEVSDIIYEGLTNMLLKSQSHFYVYRINTFEELSIHYRNENLDIVIINPILILNRLNVFQKLKRSLINISWIGLIYTYFDNEIGSKFDDVLYIADSSETISRKIGQTIKRCNCHVSSQEELSEREAEVLVQLVKGLSNKEIADKLSISIHTVIRHRKNIVEKTGIKSLSGLTIYAITKKITSLEENQS